MAIGADQGRASIADIMQWCPRAGELVVLATLGADDRGELDAGLPIELLFRAGRYVRPHVGCDGTRAYLTGYPYGQTNDLAGCGER